MTNKVDNKDWEWALH